MTTSLSEDGKCNNSYIARAPISGELPSHSEQLLLGLNELRTNEELCDIILKVGDPATRLAAHRCVLASCCSYFRAMFTSSLCEREKEEVEIKSIDCQALSALVDFAYTGKIDINYNNVQTLLVAAKFLQLKSVVKRCCDFLEAQLHPSNSIGIARFAVAYGCLDLYAAAFAYCCRTFEDVAKTDEFLEIEDVQELSRLLSSNFLSVFSEKVVFKALEAWIEYDANKRCGHLPALFKHVRLTLIPAKFLATTRESSALVLRSQAFRDHINDVLHRCIMPEERLKMAIFGEVETPRQPPKVLCAVGGKNGLFATLDSMELFLPENQNWTPVKPLDRHRYECSAVALRKKLYAIGGMRTEVGQPDSQRYHDNSAERWSAESNAWVPVTPMGRRRSNLGVAALNGKIYALGGYNGEYLDSVECYCDRTNSWREAAPMLQKRSSFAAATLDGSIFAVGGYGSTYLNSVEKYDPETNTWKMVRPMKEKRINFGVGVVHGFLYVIGGHNSVNHLRSVERYDPQRDMWTSVSPMSSPRIGLGVAVLDGLLYAAGGHSGSSYLDSVECYDPLTDKWSTSKSMNSCRCSFGFTSL